MWLKKLKNNRILTWVVVILVGVGLVAAYIPLLFVAAPETRQSQRAAPETPEAEPLSFLFATTTPTSTTRAATSTQ